MTAMHAFADESARRDYLVCTVLLALKDVADTRQALRALCMRGQRRIHMKSEGDRRRREILSNVAALDLQAHIYSAGLRTRPNRTARDDCVRAAVPDLLALGAVRLVLESCDQDHQDRQVIREAAQKVPAAGDFAYGHDRPGVEPLLWLPDIVAWAYGRDGDWRRRAAGVIATVTSVGS
ncbi:hypothetical protein [Streptomyces sp. NPDC088755]|uniref:hypothetical protein n=1 Tax=Streptomyces sp. NPDC088755 TaxID=3365888 RepID=UPI00380B79C8